MKIALYNPPVFHFTGMPPYRMNPSLGLPILAAVLNAAGHTCEVTDLEALGVSPDRLQARFAAQRDRWPDVVGVTALTASARGARDTVQAIRAAGFEGKVIVGGVHATLAYQDVLDWPGVDFVMRGECEGNIVDRLEFNLNSQDRGYFIGKPAPIGQIPAPDWEHHTPGPAQYQGNYPMLTAPQSISMWTRGCPGACIFCGNTIFGHQPIRYRPPAAIGVEMADLKARGIRSVFVYDDELVGLRLPAGWLSDVADRVGPLGLTWKAQGRCSKKHITPELMADLYRGGCRVIMWGVESFSPNVLTAIKKGTAPSDIWHTLRTAKEVGLKNWAFTMVGNYQETEEDLALTADALGQAYREGLIDYRQTTVVTALPGTELADIQKREGWYVPAPETGPQMHQCYQDTPWLTAAQIGYWMRKFDEACPVSYAGRAA